jgi:hypothetical protein
MNKSPKAVETDTISLRLDQYDDIFSDFDMRPYSERALSSDFLDEIRRASSDKSDGAIELMLYVRQTDRNPTVEPVITERLMAHFKRHHLLEKKKKKSILTKGFSMVLLGVLCMIVATHVLLQDSHESASILAMFLEPVALFLLWEGMDQIIFTSKSIEPELSFYKKMSHVEGKIRFESHND